MELKDRELKDREEKIKRDIIISKDVMDKFEEQEMKKSRPIIRNMMRSKPKIIKGNLKNKLKDKIIREIWTLFETEEENQGRRELEKYKEPNERLIKDRIMWEIRTLFEQEEDYYEPKRVSNFWNNSYIEYESNGDKNSNLSLDEYLNKIKLYLRSIIINLQNPDAWKNQLIIAIKFIFSWDTEEEPVIHSTSKKKTKIKTKKTTINPKN